MLMPREVQEPEHKILNFCISSVQHWFLRIIQKLQATRFYLEGIYMEKKYPGKVRDSVK